MRQYWVCLLLGCCLFAASEVLAQPLLISPPPAEELVHQQYMPYPQPEPVKILLFNSSPERLLVKLIPLRETVKPQQFAIEPQVRIQVELERDGGGILEQVYHIRRYGFPTQEERNRISQPPQPLYRIVVAVDRVTYSYRDPNQISAVEEFDLRSPSLLGSWLLPAGKALRNGITLDLTREALARQGY
ncbi:Hypothetical protein PBC10988_35270 [Planctomycetales bacterium 10988]|nr:Hypothetical protein PBC10988_35270 [Planctomycetales bacterium 10988]